MRIQGLQSSELRFIETIRQSSVMQLRVALRAVSTVNGAKRIFAAEILGCKRDLVLSLCDQRVAEFESEERRT